MYSWDRCLALSGLTRRKHEWVRELSYADVDRKRKEARISEARKNSSLWTAAWNLLGPVILIIAGFIFGKILSLLVPVEVASQTGQKLPAVLLGLVFVFVGRAITFWLYDRERNAIDLEYRARCRHADLAYELGKRNEYKLYRRRLCEAWHTYTGEEYPNTASYEMVMEGDIATRQLLERQLQVYDRKSLWLLRRILHTIRRTKPKRTPTARVT